jgi:hypothetical protein
MGSRVPERWVQEYQRDGFKSTREKVKEYQSGVMEHHRRHGVPKGGEEQREGVKAYQSAEWSASGVGLRSTSRGQGGV